MSQPVRIVLDMPTTLADATRVIAVEALGREGSIDAAAKAMGITTNRLRRVMDANDIAEPTTRPHASDKSVRRKAQGKARKG